MEKEEITSLLHNYHWMYAEVERLRATMDEVETHVVSQYGEEAMMPKADGRKSDPTATSALKQLRKTKRYVELCTKVAFVDRYAPLMEEDKDQTVLDCILDGLSISKIAAHLNMSRTSVYQIRDSIVETMYAKQQNEQFEHFEQSLSEGCV